MIPRVISAAGVFIGIMLFSASFVWPTVFHKPAWSDEQARELSLQRGHLHNLYGQQAHASGTNSMAEEELAELKRQIAEAREKEAQQTAEFESAKYFRDGVPAWFKWIGALLVIGGATGMLFSPKQM